MMKPRSFRKVHGLTLVFDLLFSSRTLVQKAFHGTQCVHFDASGTSKIAASNENVILTGFFKNSTSRNHSPGFTLIEILISILVLSVGLLGVTSMTVSVLKTNALSRDKTTAVTLAKDQMEILKNTPYASITDTASNNGGFTESTMLSKTNTDYADPSNPIDDKGGTTGKRMFNRYWNVADDFNGYTDTKTIVVIVEWSRHGSPKTVYLTTVRSE
ncbi:MAG: prepilin-type N-terminal cleavage/methylation domain-containing protein [Nitrospinota bacterium]